MVERLARGPAPVTELHQPFDTMLPTAVQHRGVLESAGIVTSIRVGRVRTYQLAIEALTPAAEWISRRRLPVERRLDRLDASLSRPTHRGTPLPGPDRRGLARPFRQRRERPMVRGRGRLRISTRSRMTSVSAGTASKQDSGTVDRRRGSLFTYTDIVDSKGMVFTYDMWVDDRHISTSPTTIAVEPDEA